MGRAVAFAPGGKIVVTGATASEIPGTDPHDPDDVLVARYNRDGSLDRTFSGDGLVTMDFGGLDDAADVVVQNNGDILILGTSTDPPSSQNPSAPPPSKIAFAGLRSDGSIDAVWGAQPVSLGGRDSGRALFAQMNTAVFLVGGSSGGIALARLRPRSAAGI
jgi:hypothetical protein